MRIKWFSFVRIAGLMLVLLYHFFTGVFRGGFVGVDVFFTFSGFLITSLLIDEYARHQKIDLIGFFQRRFYRIFPPLVFMILLVMPLTLLIRRDFLANIGLQIAAALGFVTNIYEILSGGNYESQFAPHLFVHTWSLALEVHFYLLWGVGAWFLGKKSKNLGQFRGIVFLVSTALFGLSFLSMFTRSFFTTNFSPIYFSSFTHSFPFFAGAILATLTGVTNTGSLLKTLEKKYEKKQIFLLMGLAGSGLVLLMLFLRFENIWTYLVGFLLATLFASLLILATRLLHEKTPDRDEPKIVRFLADTSYGVYLFHWPLYIIFTQWFGNALAVFLTTILSFALAALSFYLLEPTLAGKKPQIFGIKMDTGSITRPIFYSLLPLSLVTFFLILFAPVRSDFEENLLVNGLNQAASNMQMTRSQAEHSTATDYNVEKGTTLIGDSVALRASEWLKQAIPDIQMDSVVSRNLESGLSVYQNDIKNRVLVENVVIALGANAVEHYDQYLQQIVDQLPKGRRLILVTPYDGRVSLNEASTVAQTRQYEIALSEKYDYVFIADWYQTAIENPQIWAGTDLVHFGVDAEGIASGGELYAQTIKATLEEAQQGAVKQ